MGKNKEDLSYVSLWFSLDEGAKTYLLIEIYSDSCSCTLHHITKDLCWAREGYQTKTDRWDHTVPIVAPFILNDSTPFGGQIILQNMLY
jgi:hypothetical protein